LSKPSAPRLGCLIALFCALGPSPAAAVQLGSPDQILSLELHAFGSQGFMVSTANNYLAKTTQGNFEFTELGVNFTKPLTQKLRMGFQLFTRKLGAIGNFDIKLDWFYIDYRVRDWFGLRIGRTKLPFGLYNDSSDADSARVPVLLPQSIYPTQSRDYLLAQTGAELYGYVRLGRGGALDYRVYGGTIFLDVPVQAASPVQIVDLRVPFLVGGRLMWETPLDGLRLGASAQYLRLDTNLIVNPAAGLGPGGPLHLVAPIAMWIASIEYAAHNFLVAAEYSRWHTEANSSNEMIVPSGTTVSERTYVMASYRVNRWFQPGAYYSFLVPDVTKRRGRENLQHDIAATLRFDINPYWLIKLEGHFMAGTAYLNPTLNDGVPLALLDRYWGFILLKTTAYF